MMIGVLLSGSSAVAVLDSELEAAIGSNIMSIGIMLLTAVIGAVSAVWNPTDKARNHEILSRRFYATAKKINTQKDDAQSIEAWRDEILGIYEDEPDVFHALNAECYNAATQALGHGRKEFQKVKPWQHLLRHWWRFSAKDFRPPKVTAS